jgi:hypothetical protein
MACSTAQQSREMPWFQILSAGLCSVFPGRLRRAWVRDGEQAAVQVGQDLHRHPGLGAFAGVAARVPAGRVPASTVGRPACLSCVARTFSIRWSTPGSGRRRAWS